MAITYLDYGSGNYTSNTVPIALNSTTNFVNGKTVVVAFVFVFGSSSPTLSKPASGWTQIGSDITVGAYCKAGVYWHVWATGETSYTFTTSSATYGRGTSLAFNGVDYNSPVDTSNTGTGASGTTLTVNNISSATAGNAILGFGGSYNTSARTWSSESCATAGALSEKIDGGTRTGCSGSTLVYNSSGAVGNFTATISGSNSGWIGSLVILRQQITVTNEKSAKVKGKDTTADERAAKVTGTNASYSVNDARDVKIRGKQNIFETRPAKVHGKDSANSEKAAKVRGGLNVNDFKAAKIHGIATITETRSAKVRGQISTFEIRSAKVKGKDTTFEIRAAKVRGQDSSFNARDAKVRGQILDNSSRAAKVTGVAYGGSVDDSRDAKIKGYDTVNSGRLAKVTGVDAANSVRDAKIIGYDSLTGERNAKISGFDNDNSIRDAKIFGVLSVYSERGAKIIGYLNGEQVSDERGAKVTGYDPNPTSDRGAKIKGAVLMDYDDSLIIVGDELAIKLSNGLYLPI